jgi:Flp pilus assembly protein CpaB
MGRRAVVLVIALLLAAAAAFAIFNYLRGVEASVIEGQELVPVFRAMTLITEGTEGNTVLAQPNVLFKESQEQFQDLPDGAITTRADLDNILAGRVAVGPIPENGIITQVMWVTPSTDLKPLKESIGAGKQAITISPGDIQGVNGFAQPGDLINVIVTLDLEVGLTAGAQGPDFGVPLESGGEGDESLSVVVPYTRFVLQNLRVLATGQEVVPPETDDAPNVTAEGEIGEAGTGTVQDGTAEAPAISTIYTLEVDPNQAERLVYAIQEGAIHLTLVPDDNQAIATRGVTIETLFEGDLLADIFEN